MPELHQSLNYIRNRLSPYIDAIDEYVASEDQGAYYLVIKRRKRRGGFRYLYVCTNVKIRSAHKVIYEILREYQGQLHSSAHGFVKAKSTLTNAKNHTAQKYVLNLDIKDFFDSISLSQVEATLSRLGISGEVSRLLAKLVTVDGVLRQGLHTSPDISNHCLYEIDERLEEHASNNGLTYTRYGDDITLSGSTKPDIEIIRPIIEADGFQLNADKIKLQRRGSNQYVTGLTVFDDRPRLPRRFKKRLRLLIYYIDKYGFEDHVKRTRGINREDFGSQEEYEYYLGQALYGSSKYIIGHVAYLNSVEENRAEPFWEVLNSQHIKDYHDH